MFDLQKVYFDLHASDGTVIIAYVTRVRTLGITTSPAGIEWYAADGSRRVIRGRASLRLDGVPGTIREVEFESKAGRYLLRLTPDQGGFFPPHPEGLGFEWHCLSAKYGASLTRLDGSEAPVVGQGYADYVRLHRVPRKLGMRELHWGRIHLERETLVYTWLTRASGPPFFAVRSFQGGTVSDHPTARVEPTRDGRVHLHIEEQPPLELRPLRTLHAGAAADDARFPSLIEQGLYRALGGAMEEQRFVSQAVREQRVQGAAIHESVHFNGRRDSSPLRRGLGARFRALLC